MNSLRRGLVPAAHLASKKVIVDVGAVGTAGTIVGTAGGWLVGVVAEGLGKGPSLARAMTYGTGAGAFFGVMMVVIDRILS